MNRQPSMRRDRIAARVLVGLYPSAWRTRYAAEMLALLADTGLSARDVASLVRSAAGAWLRPARHLHAPAGRLRASISVLLVVWTALAATGLVFGQMYEDQVLPAFTSAHPGTGQLFAAYVLAAHISSGLLAVGCLPLALQLLRTAVRDRDLGGLVLLAQPVLVPTIFVFLVFGVSRLVSRPDSGVGAAWFVLLSIFGFLAAAGAIAGPIGALNRYTPAGRSTRIAFYATATAVLAMGMSLLASAADLVAVRLDRVTSLVAAPVAVIAGYLILILVALAVATASGARGISATRIQRAGSLPS